MDLTTAVLLDHCIDALIAGVNWRLLVPPSRPDYDEISALMGVVEAELVRSRFPNPPVPSFWLVNRGKAADLGR